MNAPLLEARMRFMLTLREAGVTDARVLSAMQSVPRERFVEPAFADRAYEDIPLPINEGQTISQPSVVASMTQALGVTARCKVLEIGTGSGYQAAILSRIARRVYTIERHPSLSRLAQQRFAALEYGNITAMIGDGSRGWAAQAPFDRIIVTAAAEDPPAVLLEQLRPGGVMILPVGQSNDVQQLIKVEKTDSSYHYSELADVRFVPLIADRAAD